MESLINSANPTATRRLPQIDLKEKRFFLKSAFFLKNRSFKFEHYSPLTYFPFEIRPHKRIEYKKD